MRTFESWLAGVNRVMDIVADVGVDDIADQPWRDWYDEGRTAVQAMTIALRREGFTF